MPRRARTLPRREFRGRPQKLLYRATDHGNPVLLNPAGFGGDRRDGWGPFAESFERFNAAALTTLDTKIEFSSGSNGTVIRLVPGGRAGAIPLRSAQTGHVTGGLVVSPRFGWTGVGRILMETGWAAMPEFLDLPLVPGSGREVPPWVLAGPVIARLTALMRALRRGYQQKEEVRRQPRGRILWAEYRTRSLVRGAWDRLPCRFPDLAADPQLRSQIRWAAERIQRDLALVGGTDPVALALEAVVLRLVEDLADVPPLKPQREALQRKLGGNSVMAEALRSGLEAIGWIVEERGLGGGRQSDGLAWGLPLERLWESYVEQVIRKEAAQTGAEVKVGRKGETTFQLVWSDPTHRSLGHLAPDIVVRRGRTVKLVDAKYKAHLAELDEYGWHQFQQETREAHRADLHQVLAYGSLYEADEITATLVYPLRLGTWEALHSRDRDISRAELFAGGRQLYIELRGLPFGRGLWE